MSERTLVAGVGNIFCGDDAFGVEVARRLAETDLPEGVHVGDYGISGIHLAYELLNGYGRLILIDAVPRGEPAGTVYVIEPDTAPTQPDGDADAPMDAHGMEPEAVFALLHQLGGEVERTLIVGCEPADVEEHIGLSEPVERAVDEAARVVRELVDQPSGEVVQP